MLNMSRQFGIGRNSLARTWLPIVLGVVLGVSMSWIRVINIGSCNSQTKSQQLSASILARNSDSIGPDEYGDEIQLHKADPDEDLQSEGDEDDDFEPRIITDPGKKPKVDLEANKKKIVRPRFISTELGIREKLFTGIISTQNTIDSLGVAINKTLASHLQKIIFYTDKPDEGNSDEFSNIDKIKVLEQKSMTIISNEENTQVGQLFQSLLHMYNNYQDIYDWFFIMYDHTYASPDRITQIVNHMSITRLLYMGVPMQTSIPSQDDKIIDGTYCLGDAGFIISRALLIELVPRMNDCITTITTNEADVWLGQCIISLTQGKIGCISHEEEQVYSSLHLKDVRNIENTVEDEENKEFLTATTSYPVQDERTMYLLHKKFCEIEIDLTYKTIEEIQDEIKKLAPKTPEGEAGLTWPIGVNPPFQPTQRWDIITWDYFTEDYSLTCPGEIPKCDLSPTESEDIQQVIASAVKWLNEKYNSQGLYLVKKELENGYRRFDPQRGMDYVMDIILYTASASFTIENLARTKTVEISHRMQVLKPLSHVEIVPMPYVTETSTVNILLPIQIHEKHLFQGYLEFFDKAVLATKENAQMTVIFVYSSEAAKKLEGADDPFGEQKKMLENLEKKYPAQVRKQTSDGEPTHPKTIPWMSVKTDNFNLIKIVDVISKTKKFTPEALFFLSSVAVRITSEYLNRCRMNTINNWQVFFPIPFSSFNPDLVYNKDKGEVPPENIEIKANTGHFDIYSYDDVCFYHSDYLQARVKLKTDSETDMYGMFVEKSEVHVFRAVEAALKRRWLLKTCPNPAVMPGAPFNVNAQPLSLKYCERSNAEGLAPRAVLGAKIYPEPNK